MLRTRPRDQSFLHIAALAAAGGLLSLGFSIGMPIYNALHHRPIVPEFFFFGVWGVLALCGAAGCIHTYLISGDGPPKKPPKGGVPVRAFTVLEGGKPRAEESDQTRRAA